MNECKNNLKFFNKQIKMDEKHNNFESLRHTIKNKNKIRYELKLHKNKYQD